MRRSSSAVCGGVLALVAMPSAWARFEPAACKNAFTVEQEQTEGAKVAAQVYQQMPVLPENDPVSRYVQQVGMRLTAHAPGQPWPYSFHVVASSEVNAFALPGGSMFVNLGTVQAAETEAQLAGVMAHEASHVVLRHSTCNLTAEQGKKVLYGLGSALSSVLLGNGTAGSIAQMGLGMGENLQFLRMSRDDEKQADLLGTDILYDTGYDPRGMPQFFETIQAKYGAGGAQLLSDHPNPGNRMQYVTAEIETLPQRTGSTVTTPEFSRVHGLAMGAKSYTAAEMQTGAWKQTGQYIGAPGAVAQAGSRVPVQQPQSQQSVPPAAGGNGVATAARLSRSAVGVGTRLAAFRGERFLMSYPTSWQHSEDASGTVSFAPVGGGGVAGVTYGAVVGLETEPGDGVSDAASLARATAALTQKLSQQNGGLQQIGQTVASTMNGLAVNVVELRGRSAIVEGGQSLTEHDRLVTFARTDGDVSYIVFVSPERDLVMMNSIFAAMKASFRVQ